MCGIPLQKIVRFLYRVLLFKLIFCSGIVKWVSGDTAWRGLTALQYHFYTQPLPNATAWYMHQLPDSLLSISCAIMFVIELFVPFLFFTTQRLRTIAFCLQVFLQIGIAATGNYAFFNLLTCVLCLCLMDSKVLQNLRIRKYIWKNHMNKGCNSKPWLLVVIIPLGLLLIVISVLQISSACKFHIKWPRPILATYQWIAPFRSVNNYGLFAVMTTSRPEILIEGSQDGKQWFAYEFKWKVGDLYQRPRMIAPHQPRLDWQMWFAALSSYHHHPWFVNLLVKLSEGSDDVLGLLKDNPFLEQPPRYIRATLYEYHFSDWSTKKEEGVWWTREKKRLYCPVLEKKQDEG